MTVARGHLYIVWLCGQQGLQWWNPQHYNQHIIQRVLKQLPNPSVQEAIDPEAQSFCDRGLLANYHSFSLRGRFLIKQTSMAECNSFQRSQRVGAIFTLSLFWIPEHLYILDGRSFMFLVPLFLYLVPCFLQVSPGDVPWLPGSGGLGGLVFLCLTNRETVLGKLSLTGHFTDNILKFTSSLSVKEAYFLVQVLWSEGQASGLAHK